MALLSRLIRGTKPEANTLLALQQSMGLPPNRSIGLLVLEITLGMKTVYACLSGGKVVDGDLRLTLVGGAALEALLNLPMGGDSQLIIQEVAIGATLLEDKVLAAVERAPDGAKICFVGDMQGELDGKILPALKLSDGVIDIAH